MKSDTKINDDRLGLSNRAYRILCKWHHSQTTSNDVPTIADLNQKGLSSVELQRLKGAGKVALFEVENAFRRVNLHLLPF